MLRYKYILYINKKCYEIKNYEQATNVGSIQITKHFMI